MITIESLDNAIQRIDAINRRFGISVGNIHPTREKDKGFAKELADATEKLEKTDKVNQKKLTAEDINDDKLVSADIASMRATRNENKTKRHSLATDIDDTAAMIEAAAKKYNVDARLVSAVAETESNGNQDAISPAGAIGVMQLMPSTAASLGVDPYDKRQNIEGGAKYIRQMLDTFGGDVQKAVAAYNAGPQAVKDYGGIPPYRETQNYVNKVLDIYW